MTRDYAPTRPIRPRRLPRVTRCGGCGVWRLVSRHDCRVCGWVAPR
jgi:hypothetical protein